MMVMFLREEADLGPTGMSEPPFHKKFDFSFNYVSVCEYTCENMYVSSGACEASGAGFS